MLLLHELLFHLGRSAYHVFVLEYMQEESATSRKEHMTNCGERWSSLSAEEKHKYAEKLEQLKRKHAKQVEKFNRVSILNGR